MCVCVMVVTRCPLTPSPPRRLLVGAPWDGDGQGDVYKCRVGPPNATCAKANLGTATGTGWPRLARCGSVAIAARWRRRSG